MVEDHAARDLHRNRSWACKWLKRYDKEGIEGLKDRPKSGRRPELSEEESTRFKLLSKRVTRARPQNRLRN